MLFTPEEQVFKAILVKTSFERDCHENANNRTNQINSTGETLPMKKCCPLLLLLLALWSCNVKPTFNDTTKEARHKALTALKSLDSIPEQTFREELVKSGAIINLTGDIHQYKLRQAFSALAASNCFNLFKSHNKELARCFDAMINAPSSVFGRLMADIIDEGVAPGVTIKSDELQKLSPQELQKAVLQKKLVAEKDLYGMPHNYLRFVLFLDSQVRPQYRDDALYLYIRRQLLESRPTVKRGAQDILELQVKGDSLIVENKQIGPLSDIINIKDRKTLDDITKTTDNKTVQKFDKQLHKYNERHARQRRLRGDKESIAPDFYAKSMKRDRIVLGEDILIDKKVEKKPLRKKGAKSPSKSSGAPRSRVMKKGLFSKMSGPITTSPVAGADPFGKRGRGLKPTPPIGKDVASIIIDDKTSQNSLLKLIEIISRLKFNDIYLISTSGETALFRVSAHGSSSSTRRYRLWDYTLVEDSYSVRMQGTLDLTPTTIVHFKRSNLSPQKLVQTMAQASDNRNYTLSFDTSGQLLSIKDTLHYSVSNRVLLGKNAFTTVSNDPFGKGGYAAGIDAILAGTGGLRRGDGSSSGGIGFGVGTGSGFGGGRGGVDISSLSGDGTKSTTVKRKKIKRVARKNGSSSSAGMTGGRSRANIMRTVRNNMASLKYAYNRRLRAKPGIKGRIVVKWAIDEFGNVLHCKVVRSTMKDPTFEKEVTRKIKAWAFGKIPIPGDVTEVTYPFVFTQ